GSSRGGLSDLRGPAPLRSSLPRLVGQGHCRDTGCNVQPGHALDAERLQSDRISRAADQHIGTKANGDSRAGGRADIRPGQRSWRDIGGRGDARPKKHTPRTKTHIDAQFVVPTRIKLKQTTTPRKRDVYGTAHA